MAGHTSGGAAGTGWEYIHDVPCKTGTYVKGQVGQWVSTNARFELTTTRQYGGKVFVEGKTLSTNLEPLSVVWNGPAKVKFDAVAEHGYPVWPSDATAGQVEKWAMGTIGTATKVTTAITKAIKQLITDQGQVMGQTMEEILGTTTYYMIWTGAI